MFVFLKYRIILSGMKRIHLSEEEKTAVKEKTRNNLVNHYSWDKTAEKLIEEGVTSLILLSKSGKCSSSNKSKIDKTLISSF